MSTVSNIRYNLGALDSSQERRRDYADSVKQTLRLIEQGATSDLDLMVKADMEAMAITQPAGMFSCPMFFPM